MMLLGGKKEKTLGWAISLNFRQMITNRSLQSNTHILTTLRPVYFTHSKPLTNGRWARDEKGYMSLGDVRRLHQLREQDVRNEDLIQIGSVECDDRFELDISESKIRCKNRNTKLTSYVLL